jgi:hypothetical protein
MRLDKKLMLSALTWAGKVAAGAPSRRRALFNALRLGRPGIDSLRADPALQYLAYVFARRDRSRAQILQDLWVCYELEDKRGGFFVEFGATNGLTNSNTWLLEKEYAWTGILSEPNPSWHAELALNRSCQIDHRCVSSVSGRKVPFLLADHADPELSGIAEFSGGDHFADVRARGQLTEIESVCLNDLLSENGAPREIDYMSIDTEGSEFDILSAFDFTRHSIRLISVEQNSRTEGPIGALLQSHGYERVFPEYSQWDGWYRHRDVRAGRPPAAWRQAKP